MTCGGQEIPLQEAKLTGLVTATHNYSCGDESSSIISGGELIPHDLMFEIESSSLKASVLSRDIFLFMKRATRMDSRHKDKKGSIARKYVIDNYSVDKLVARLEKVFDSADPCRISPYPLPKPPESYDESANVTQDEFLERVFSDVGGGFLPQTNSYVKVCREIFSKLNGNKRAVHEVVRIAKTLQKNGFNRDCYEKFALGQRSVVDPSDFCNFVCVVIPPSESLTLAANSFVGAISYANGKSKVIVFADSRYFDLIRDNPHVAETLPLGAFSKDMKFKKVINFPTPSSSVSI
jgi:hypothetical protein